MRTGRREMLVLRLVCNIARRWKVAAEGHHVRCSQCGTIAGPFEGSPLWVAAIAQLAREYGETPRASGARLRKGRSAQSRRGARQ